MSAIFRLAAPSALAAVALALCSAGAVGCASSQSKIQHDLATMQRESKPDRLTARGEAFAAVGDMTRAEQYFVAAVKGGGDPGRLVRRLIAVCVADGRYPAALEYADDYLRKYPNDAEVKYAGTTLRQVINNPDAGQLTAMRSVP